MSQQMSQKQLCVAPAEGSIGYTLCRELTQGGSKQHFGKIKAGVANMQSPWVQKLKDLPNIEVFHLNLQDPSKLERELQNVELLALVPDFSIWMGKQNESMQDMVNCCKLLAQSSQKANVKGCVLISQINAQETKYKTLNGFEQIEKEALKNVNWQWGHVVLRKSLLNEVLLHYSSMIQQNELGLPISENDAFVPISMNDVAQCACIVLADMMRQDKKHQGQVYNLTSDQKITPKHLVDIMNKTLGGANIRFKQISESDARKFLEQEVKLPKLRVESLIEEWQMVKDNKLSMVTNDVMKIKNEKPITLESWVKDNSANFRPRGMGM